MCKQMWKIIFCFLTAATFAYGKDIVFLSDTLFTRWDTSSNGDIYPLYWDTVSVINTADYAIRIDSIAVLFDNYDCKFGSSYGSAVEIRFDTDKNEETTGNSYHYRTPQTWQPAAIDVPFIYENSKKDTLRLYGFIILFMDYEATCTDSMGRKYNASKQSMNFSDNYMVVKLVFYTQQRESDTIFYKGIVLFNTGNFIRHNPFANRTRKMQFSCFEYNTLGRRIKWHNHKERISPVWQMLFENKKNRE